MSDEILTVQEVAALLKVADKTVYTMAQKGTVAPNGFKGMVVTFDQECCLLYKATLDKILPPEATEVVISATGSDERFKPYARSRDEEEKILDRFRDPNDPLKLLIVTAKLLTGFDAPILQAMYLDKLLRDHTLLQAICRTNRTYERPRRRHLGSREEEPRQGRAGDHQSRVQPRAPASLRGGRAPVPELCPDRLAAACLRGAGRR